MSDNNSERIEIQITIDFGTFYSLKEPQKTIRELDIMRGASKTVAQHIAYLVDAHHVGDVENLSDVSEAILLLSRISFAFIEKSEFLSNDLFLRVQDEKKGDKDA